MPTIVTKPIEFFQPDPGNPRKDFPEAELRLLGASLLKKQLVPLIVRKSGVIVDGERRWRAAKLVGLKTLDCYLVDDTADEGEIKEIQLVTALHRADLRPYEVYLGFVDWMKAHPGKTGKDLAGAIDRSEAAVSMTLSLHRCIPAVKEAAKEGKVGLKDWYLMSQAGEQEQAAMLEAKLSGATREEVERRGRKAGNGESQVTAPRVTMHFAGGVKVVLSGPEMALDDVIDALSTGLEAARKASKENLSVKTAQKLWQDKSRAK